MRASSHLRHFRLADAGGAEAGGQRFGDLPGLPPQGFGQIEGGGEGEVAHLDPGRILEGDRLGSHVERDAEGRTNRVRQGGVPLEYHGIIIPVGMIC